MVQRALSVCQSQEDGDGPLHKEKETRSTEGTRPPGHYTKFRIRSEIPGGNLRCQTNLRPVQWMNSRTRRRDLRADEYTIQP